MSRKRPDPRPVGDVLAGLGRTPGWGAAMTLVRIQREWAEIAGAVVAARSKPAKIEGATLTVMSEPGAWATELSLLSSTLVRRLGEVVPEAGIDTVRVATAGGSPRSRR